LAERCGLEGEEEEPPAEERSQAASPEDGRWEMGDEGLSSIFDLLSTIFDLFAPGEEIFR
jgi:hypothetical protein